MTYILALRPNEIDPRIQWTSIQMHGNQIKSIFLIFNFENGFVVTATLAINNK